MAEHDDALTVGGAVNAIDAVKEIGPPNAQELIDGLIADTLNLSGTLEVTLCVMQSASRCPADLAALTDQERQEVAAALATLPDAIAKLQDQLGT